MGYRKDVRGDHNQASEVGSFNRVFIDFNGTGMVILALFVVVLVSIALIWMVVKNGGLLAILVELSFIGFFFGAGVIGVCFVVRYWSGTRRQLNSDKAAQAWEKLVHYTDSHVILLDPELTHEKSYFGKYVAL